jgi:hypothetical protein
MTTRIPQIGPSLSRRMKAIFRGWSLAAIILFAALLSLGVAIYRDYGISWDETIQRSFGKNNYFYIVNGEPPLSIIEGGRYYGPIYEIFLFRLTYTPKIDQEYYARHLFTFLTFAAGVFGFYFLIRRLWRKNWLAVAGSLALVLSPRIFADAFYNTKDIPFMVGFIFAVYTLVRFLDHSSFKNILLHALFSAILIDIRIPGVAIVAMTIGFIGIDLLLNKPRSSRAALTGLSKLIVYLVVCAGFVILFWPNLWHDPGGQFLLAFKEMSNYPKDETILFKGYFVNFAPPPLTYIPTWIAISTPLVIIVGFVAGLISSTREIVFKASWVFEREKRNLWIMLAWFFFPLIMVILLKSTLYNAWRQMFFIYPALILVALQGLRGLLKVVDWLPRPRIGQAGLACLIVIGMIDPVSFMIRNHPYQNVYFNRLAGENLKSARSLYEMDYWGLSCKADLDFILKTEPVGEITVFDVDPTASYNATLLPEAQRSRLIFTNDIAQAQYFIGGYRNHPQDYPYLNEVFNVSVDGAKLTSVFKLK